MFSADEKNEFMTEITAQRLVATTDPARAREAELLLLLASSQEYIEPVMIGSITALSTDALSDTSDEIKQFAASVCVASRELLLDFIGAVLHPQGRLTEEMQALTGGDIGKSLDDIMLSARHFCDNVRLAAQ